MIVIIGAGLAGLAAGQMLIESGYKDFIIIEAQDYVGGRVKSIDAPFNIQTLNYNYIFELGARWLYGGNENPIYEWLLDNDYIEKFEQSEELKCEGVFATQDGEVIPTERIEPILTSLTEAKRMFCNLKRSQMASNRPFVNNLREALSQISEYCAKHQPVNEQDVTGAVREWFELRECVDKSCKRFDDLSTRAYGRKHTDKVLYVNWQRVVNKMADSIGRHRIYLRSPVDHVEHSKQSAKVVLVSGIAIECDHTLVTIPIGALRRPRPWPDSPPSFIHPQLGASRQEQFDSVGFGRATKIFLKFKGPVLEQSRGLKLLWTQEPEGVGLPDWTKCIESFQLDREEPYLLLVQLGGSGSLEAEMCSDERIGQICVDVLETFLPNEEFPELLKVVVSRWSTNRYIRGGNSYPSVRGDDYESIWEPICGGPQGDATNIPRILFAGEATAGNSYGTAHGAILSGQREAERLLGLLPAPCEIRDYDDYLEYLAGD